MARANTAKVEWNAGKKRWEVRIEVGEEVVKRPIPEPTKEQAIAVARDEGYDLDPADITIENSAGHPA
jgi:hypothetical protein